MRRVLFLLALSLICCKHLRFMEDAAAAGQTAKSFKGFENLSKGVGQVCGMWNDIVGAFKTTHSSVIKKLIPGEGFRKISLSTSYMSAGGFRMTAWDSVWARKLPLFGLTDEERLKKVMDYLEFAQFSDSATWASTNLGFNTEEGSRDNVKSITLLTNVRDDNKFDMTIIDFSLAFKLQPDIQWVSTAGSYAGGIFENQKDELIEVPRTLKDEDVTAIMEMFKLLSLKAIASLAGVTLEVSI